MSQTIQTTLSDHPLDKEPSQKQLDECVKSLQSLVYGENEQELFNYPPAQMVVHHTKETIPSTTNPPNDQPNPTTIPTPPPSTPNPSKIVTNIPLKISSINSSFTPSTMVTQLPSNPQNPSSNESSSSSSNPDDPTKSKKRKKEPVDIDLTCEDNPTQPPTKITKTTNTPQKSPKSPKLRPSQDTLTCCPICTVTFEELTSDLRQKHLNMCLDVPLDDDFERDLLLCEFCGRSLTSYGPDQRQAHLNRCCDQFEHDYAILKGRLGDMTSSLYACPICTLNLSDEGTKIRIQHLKYCAKKHQTSVSDLSRQQQLARQEFKKDSPEGSLTPRAPLAKPQVTSKTSKFFMPVAGVKKKSRKKKKKIDEPDFNDEDFLATLDLPDKSVITDQISVSVTNNFGDSVMPNQSKVSVSQEKVVNEKLVDALFPIHDASPTSTPQFTESVLSKKYANPNHSNLHKKQVTTVWKTTPPRFSKKQDEDTSIYDETFQEIVSVSNSQVLINDIGTSQHTIHQTTTICSSPLRGDTMPSPKDKKSPVPVSTKPVVPPQPPSEFPAELKKILTDYQSQCTKHKDVFLQQVEALKKSYYAEIGKLTLDKEMKVNRLIRKHNIPTASSPFFGLAHSFPIPRAELVEGLTPQTVKSKSVSFEPQTDSTKPENDEIESEDEDELESLPECKDLVEQEREIESEEREQKTVVNNQEPRAFNLASSPPNHSGNFVEVNSFSSPE